MLQKGENMLRINQIRMPVPYDRDMLRQAILKKLGIRPADLIDFSILRESLDARKSKNAGHQGSPCYQLSVCVSLQNEKKFLSGKGNKDVTAYQPVYYEFPFHARENLQSRPIIIGTGPAGLFCGLMLARAGFRPILFERGSSLSERVRKVEDFWNGGPLDPECNAQFGEGGAGTFSDGKLNTLVKDPSGLHRKVLEIFAEAGAPEEILYVQKPHLGTDQLVHIVRNIREEILSLGGQIHFDSKVTGLQIREGRICGVIVNGEKEYASDSVVLAPGHSARDTFRMLYGLQTIDMEQKAFAIGLRIEHPQEMIGRMQYGDYYDKLPAADYKLTAKTSNGRSAYTFCMCPGGYVVNASSQEGMTAVNGMSNRSRDGQNANSAVIVTVTPEDFGSDHPLAGVSFQEEWERRAWQEGKGKVPVQLYEDFQTGKISSAFGQVQPMHKGAVTFGNLRNCLPDYVCESLDEGISLMGHRLKGFDRPDAILSGVETRTSSPVRIVRGQDGQSSLPGLFPCGEGAGYAGGITSAAMDGIRIAEAVARFYEGESTL
jgi:uncharacterized FAD-dependent dehydrogenase